MGRNRNEEERNRLTQVAFNLFRKKGYDDTSFNDIAKSANIQKSMVQYYFPKKENLIHLYTQRVLSKAYKLVQAQYPDFDTIDQIYTTGYLVFSFFYRDNQTEHLVKTILEQRGNTSMAIDEVIKWAMGHLDTDDEDVKHRLSKAIVYAAGGGCEYVYYVLSHNIPSTPDDIVSNCLDIANLIFDRTLSRENPQPKIDQEWLKAACKDLMKSLYTL